MNRTRSFYLVAVTGALALVPLASYPPQAIVEASPCYSHLPENEKVLHHNPDCVTVTTMEQKLAEVSDIFDSVVCLDESLRQEGFEDGYKDGLVAGKEEGKEAALKMGFQVAEELGFYQGCVDVWNSVIQVDSGAFSSRLQKSVQQLGDLLRRYPLLDPENEQVHEMMDAIRLKVRIISANMGVKLEYKGYTKSSTQGMEDM
ncbi:Essential protein Yae1, N terminal [Musa troglodytarum]|uniref:Essential protein Yae1, N terminal n=1 Tax=Musa troglodytarum TaxID=320322 RepID=A0A9E7EC78_9LILI|nr:Essential protein Yae1, N terminal [Musa troglodytarum]